jgi:DNA-binding response OmpR family regulator
LLYNRKKKEEIQMSGILIVDDDKEIQKLLKLLLNNANYDTFEVGSGEEALAVLRSEQDPEKLSLVLLDVALPGINGFETGSEIRKFSNIPILYLTAQGQEYDKIMGFASGGDDYLVKPFTPSELLARVGALLRRYFRYGADESSTPRKKFVLIGELCIDEDACKVTIAGQEKKLTAKEYEILLLLCKTCGKVFSADNIYDSIWGEDGGESAANVVMVHIRKIREKIERNPQKPEYLKTVWGMGYKIDY